MPLRTALTNMLGIEPPIIQGGVRHVLQTFLSLDIGAPRWGMQYVGYAEMAAAVSNVPWFETKNATKQEHISTRTHTHMRRMSKFQHFVWDKLRRITWQDPSQYSTSACISQLLRFVLGGGGGVTKGVKNWKWVVLLVFVFIRIGKNAARGGLALGLGA